MMNNNSDISYFKIGSFVLIGLGLIVFALLMFGLSELFQPVVHVETYFRESIQGVSDGTQVKYRGLQIGYVDKIAFTSEEYGNDVEGSGVKIHNRSIYVRIAITSKVFTHLARDRVEELFAREVEHGLRIKLAAQGLTGISYLELNYVDPKSSDPYNITWHPHDIYIPSTTSALTKLSENAQYIMNELKDINFKKIFNDFDVLTVSLAKVASKTDNSLSQINDPLVTAMQNFKIISTNLRQFSEQLKINPSSIVLGKPPLPLDPSKL